MNFKSITKSTYISEGLDALREAKKVKSFNKLKNSVTINQNSDYSRRTCWSQINKRYIETNKDKITNYSLVKLVDFEDMKLNRELMYFHYLNSEPLAKFTVLNLIYPRLLSEEEYQLKRDDVIFFIKDYISFSDATVKKTARSIVKAMIDFGMAVQKVNRVFVKWYRPSLTAFLYGIYSEYSSGFAKAQNYNILNPSIEHIREKSEFYKLFLIKPAVLNTYLKISWEKGYLNYEPRGGLNQYVLKQESLSNFVNQLIKEEE
ncbi:MAG: hypothetical protein ACOCQA_00965 [bacterium]